MSEAGKRLKFYGAVEVEANWEPHEAAPAAGKTRSESDITLATAELFVEAAINKYVTGVMHFLWEEGSTEPVDIDEAFILLGQTDDVPWYLMAGRIYPAVGLFESYFISDPLTQGVVRDPGFRGGDWLLHRLDQCGRRYVQLRRA